MSELCLWVRFDPRRVPSAVETFAETDRADWREPIDLRGGATAHVLRRGFGPGRLGIRWEW
jgi:hypothetical protein